MRRRDKGEPVAVQIERMEDQLHILDGLARALDEPHAVLDIVLRAEDPDAAVAALQEALGVDRAQATAVLDLQFRRATVVDRRNVQDRRREIAEHVADLRARDDS